MPISSSVSELLDRCELFSPAPRAYQSALFEKAQRENTIVFLPPATGKTYVAAMLIKAFADDTEDKISLGGKRSLLLLDTHILSQQRKEYVAKYTGLRVGPASEDEGCLRKLKADAWRRCFDRYQVLVIKAKRFAEILKSGYIELKDVNLLIFDECHSAWKKSAIIKIMDAYEKTAEHERPRVLGLTASLLDRDVPFGRIDRAIARLERRLHASVATVGQGRGGDVARYFPAPMEKHVPYDEPVQLTVVDEVRKVIRTVTELVTGCRYEQTGAAGAAHLKDHILLKQPELSRRLVQHLMDVWYNIDKLGVYGGSISATKLMMFVQRMGAKCEDANAAMVYLSFVKVLVIVRDILEKKMAAACNIAKLYEYSSSQVTTLLDVLKEFKLGNSRCIIFVERRTTAEVLYLILKVASTSIESLSFIRPDFIVGVGFDPVTSDTRQFLNEGNMDIFERFKSGEINILVTNDILKDGFDIPECKLVVRFDIPQTYRSYVLSKGWAMLGNSYHVILTPRRDRREVWKKMIEYRSKEDFLNQILLGGKTHDNQ